MIQRSKGKVPGSVPVLSKGKRSKLPPLAVPPLLVLFLLAVASPLTGAQAPGSETRGATGVHSSPPRQQNPAPGEEIEPTQAVPGASLSVYLLTAEPGDAIWELFGHNALLVRDRLTGRDHAFNYGIFDFRAPNFYLHFLRGEMTYAVASVSLDRFLAGYRGTNRRVWAQELDLEVAQKAELFLLLQTAALPENRFYRYHYFLNNCSTKLRDALDTVLNGQLRRATEPAPSQATWRDHTRRLTATSLMGYLGIQLLLGPRGDEPTTPWEEMWVPMKLRDQVGALVVTKSDGTRAPLVRSEEVWVASTREPEPVAPPSFNLLFPLFGLGVGLIFVLLGYWAEEGSGLSRAALGFAGFAWGGFCSVVTLLIVFMHWTAHEFLYLNQNILVFNPAGLGLAVLVPRAVQRMETRPWDRRVSAFAVALVLAALILSLLPGLSQGNQEWIAFALPVHLSVWWVVNRILRTEHALIYSAAAGPLR